MKRTLLINLLVVTFFFVAYNLIGVQTSEAVEEYHQPGVTEKASVSSKPQDFGMMPGTGAGGGSGMMGMMNGPDDEGDQAMMGMMMAQMMGGPGGMGKMMGQMGSGMKGRGGGPGGMAYMARMLDNLDLTPEQWEQVRTLARQRLDKMVDLWAQRMKLQIELAGLRWDKKIDPQQVKDLFVKKAEAKAEMFLVGLEYLRGLKGILTPEQLKKLEAQGF